MIREENVSNALRAQVASLTERVKTLEEIIAEALGPQVVEATPEEAETVEVGELSDQDDLQKKYGERVGGLLYDEGYTSVAAVEEASDEDLLAIDGLGTASLETIREAE